MNIHRKDRAKAKQSTPNSSLSNRFSNEESFASASPFLSEISSGQQSSKFYSIFEVQGNYNMYFQPSSATNPGDPSPAPYAFPFEYLNPRSHRQSVDVNPELLGANLSLQIGPSHVESNQKDGEVDLELRLGHHPY
ncbi:uncharacterized protein LOC114751188 [Neltuma alba]|uniref:uncharacterized protein LOC114751188 n=1 Tax=Neltuma alba TaxID=207710 RepID=UPI0010A59663|nr:uncharacterized protein LOC114751188 [Prosopis alba]